MQRTKKVVGIRNSSLLQTPILVELLEHLRMLCRERMCRATLINEEMKLAAAEAIAAIITDKERDKHYIIPSVFNPNIVRTVRDHVILAAIRTQVARRIPREYR